MSMLNEADEAERASLAAFERVEMLLGSTEKSRGDVSFQSDMFANSPYLSRRSVAAPDNSFKYSSPDKKIRISVRYWDGSTIDVTVYPNMTVSSMKKLCARDAPIANIHSNQLEISSNGRILNDSWTLDECSISRGSVIYVALPGHHSHRGGRGRAHHDLPFGAFMPSPVAPRHEDLEDSFLGMSSATPMTRPGRGVPSSSALMSGSRSVRGNDFSSLGPAAATSYFRAPLKSEESSFHSLIESEMDEVGDRIVGVPLEDEVAQSRLADRYAEDAAQRHEDAKKDRNRIADASAQGLTSSKRLTGELQLERNVEECRTERDTWSLLALLVKADLLKDLDDAENRASLAEAMSSLDPSDSVRCVVDTCLESDERIKKARVVRDWLESASEDQVHEPPISPSPPWSQTLDRLLTGRRPGDSLVHRRDGGDSKDDLEVQSAHPDAQLGSKGFIKPLDGLDNVDQESVMKVVWQCVRSGQVGRAQQIAQQHRWFWLTAALMGLQQEYYQSSGPDHGLFGADEEAKDSDVLAGWGGTGVSRRGNTNRAVWMQTCWKYSCLVDSNPSNKKTPQASGRRVARDAELGGGSHVGALEAVVYAALSCNLQTMLGSRLVATWTDSLWAVVTCAHERQLTASISEFHKRRAAHSRLYPGCTKAVLTAEKQFLQRTEDLSGYFDDNCEKLFRRLDKPVSATGSEVTVMLLELQVAIIKGQSALQRFIQDTVVPYAIATLEAVAPASNLSPADMESISLSSPKHAMNSQSSTGRSLPGMHSTGAVVSADDTAFTHQKTRMLRIFAHLVLWLRFSCPHCESLTAMAPNKVIYVVLEAYIEQLIHRRQYSLVALYAAFLSRPRRVDKYVTMMRRISPNSTRHAIGLREDATGAGSTSLALSLNDDTATAVEVLQLAHKFFREEEVLEITKEVVEGARKGRRGWCDYDDLDDPNVTSVSIQQTPAHYQRSGLHSTQLSLSQHQQTPLTRGIPATPASAWSTRSNVSLGFSRSNLATPFHANGSMTLTLGGGVGDVSDGNDTGRLESLRWLCHRPDQRVAAVSEANAFLRALMLESHGSKTAQVRMLLWDILPPQVLREGDLQQAARTDHLSNEGRLQQAVAEEESWGAEVCQLHFWQGFDASVVLFERWNEEVAKPYKELSAMLGDASTKAKSLAHHRPMVRRAAEEAVAGILAALTCSHREVGRSQSVEDNEVDRQSLESLYASGYQEVWVRFIDAAYNGLTERLGRFLGSNPQDSDEDLAPHESVAELWTEICTMSTEIQTAADMYPQGYVSSTGALCSLYGYPPQMRQIMSTLEQIKDRFGDTRLCYDALTNSRDVIASIIESRKAMRLVLFLLLNSYIKICSQTGDLMETLEESTEALRWYREAVRTANLIADDEQSGMQLYRSLCSSDLKVLLTAIHHSSMHVLRLGKAAGFAMA